MNTKSFFLIFFLHITLFVNAQNQADVDLAFPIDTFNSVIRTSAIQTDGKIIVGGYFTLYDGTNYNRLVRLNSDGSPDVNFDIGSGFNGSVFKVVLQADGKILVGGNFTSFNGTTRGNIVRLNHDGSEDATFNMGIGFFDINYTTVNSIKIQTNGKILIGGSFVAYNGISCNRIIRLNSDGTSDNSFNVNTNLGGDVLTMEIQTDGKILAGGYFNYSHNSIVTGGLIRLNTDGTYDSTFNIGTGTNSNFPVSSIKTQPDGKIIIGGYFNSFNGLNRPRLVRLNTDGSIDINFNNGSGFDTAYVNSVYDVFIQSDGKILVAGALNVYNGSPHGSLIKLFNDGIVDSSFNAGQGVAGTVYTINVDATGKLIVGGDFKMYEKSYSQPTRYKRYLMRLNSDSSIDENFITVKGFDERIKTIKLQLDGKLLVGGGYNSYNRLLKYKLSRLTTNGVSDNSFNIGAGFNEEIETIEVTADGKIFVGGQFTNFNGTAQNRLIKLNDNGSIDNSFSIGNGFNENVRCIALQQDGKIIVGGSFTQFNGVNNNYIARLNSNGSTDSSFTIGTGFNGTITKIIIQADGKIIVGGYFSNYNGLAKNNLLRLNQNGSLDASFAIGSGFNGGVMSLTQQSSGKIVVGGAFTNFNGFVKNYIVRLNVNGDLDSTFNTGSGFTNFVSSVKNLANGKILIVGDFSQYNGSLCNRIIQLNQDGTVDNSFTIGNGFSHDVNVYMTRFETNSIEVQQDDKIWICGQYSSFNNYNSNSLIRLKGSNILSDSTFNFKNEISIYPNPANEYITIDCGNLANVSGWNIKIVNTIGQEVFSGAMNTQQYVVPLNTWSGQGIYFVKIYDASNNLMNTKKIILQ
jgi:uncharacterized delta-60 repeat protein